LVFLLFFRSGEISFSVCSYRSSLSLAALRAKVRWMLLREDVGIEMVDLSLFLDFVDEMWWILVQGGTGMAADQCATTCALMLAACLFIDSEILIGNGASLDLAMVETRCLFQHASR
jgi:hypothetical protein